MKNIKIALVITLAFLAVFVSFFNYFYLKSIEGRLSDIEKNVGIKDDAVTADLQAIAEEELITFSGILRKEKIPEGLDLGDYWYWLYLDEPYDIEGNASGEPWAAEKLQVTMGSDELDGEHVVVTGTLGWGYAESNVIYAVDIRAE